MRQWWSAAGGPDLVLLLGPVREEQRHYIPPGAPQVTALVGWRPREEPESVAATAAVADRVLLAGGDPADAWTADEPAGPEVVVLDPAAALVTPHTAAWASPERQRLSSRIGVPTEATLVLGLGPTDWRGAPDLLLRSFHRLHRLAPERDLHLAWLGGTPEHADAYPYHFDVARLGLQDRVHWLGDPADHVDLLGRADLIALVGREPYTIPVERRGPGFHETPELLSWLRVPIVGLDLPSNRPLGGRWATWVPYPDTDGMAVAMASVLDEAEAERALPLPERLAVVGARLLAGGPA